MAEDNVGNIVGKRGTFEYLTDAGVTINYSADASVGIAVGNTVATINRGAKSVNDKYLQGRYVLAQQNADPSVKKKIIVGSPTNPLMVAAAGQIIPINGTQYTITGRVGEKASYLRLTATAPDPV